ncbi:MAG: hypothetical protein WCG84_02735 [Candidatus Moraniibacteriota bacterium]
MQWMYLILFALAIMTPSVIVQRDYLWIGQESLEGLIIFLLGVIGFSFFYFQERSLRKHLDEKKKYQREAVDASRDLVQSYSYIGEVNRQLEMLKEITLSMPTKQKITNKEREKAFSVMLEAIVMFARTENASICFANMLTKQIEEVKTIGKKKQALVSVEEVLEQKESLAEYGDVAILQLTQEEDGYRVFLCVEKKNGMAENVSFLKAILAQALALFVRTKK